MLAKRELELIHSLDHITSLRVDLCHAIDKRDAVGADVTSLNAQIAELEARLSAVENGIALLKGPPRT